MIHPNYQTRIIKINNYLWYYFAQNIESKKFICGHENNKTVAVETMEHKLKEIL